MPRSMFQRLVRDQRHPSTGIFAANLLCDQCGHIRHSGKDAPLADIRILSSEEVTSEYLRDERIFDLDIRCAEAGCEARVIVLAPSTIDTTAHHIAVRDGSIVSEGSARCARGYPAKAPLSLSQADIRERPYAQ